MKKKERRKKEKSGYNFQKLKMPVHRKLLCSKAVPWRVKKPSINVSDFSEIIVVLIGKLQTQDIHISLAIWKWNQYTMTKDSIIASEGLTWSNGKNCFWPSHYLFKARYLSRKNYSLAYLFIGTTIKLHFQ